MKKLLFCFLLLLTWTARAQSFEGIIKWSMKADITDPAAKVKMEDAKNKMNTPENQAKLKTMQDKMNDPQFKAMMDANPQMKAQMEGAIKMMSGGGDMTSLAPSGVTIKIKGDNALTSIEGGPMATDVLYLKDKDQSYSINRAAQTYSKLPSSSNQEAQSSGQTPPKVTKTTETMKILGHNCTKYLVEITERGQTINESIWTTTEIKNIDFKKFAKAKVGRGQNMYFEGIDGVPLRIDTVIPQGSMSMQVTEITPQTLSASDFTLPANFKETQGGMFGDH